jgi:hypothetical protein
LPEHIVVTLKNDSALRIIAADIVLVKKKTNERQTYKAYPEYPIDSGTVGTMSGSVLTGLAAEKDFTAGFAWDYETVYGVPEH